MFKCEAGHVSERGQKMTKAVLETRAKTYPARAYDTKYGTVHDPGGIGREIVREGKFCPDHLVGAAR
jgi:hypothetical protein